MDILLSHGVNPRSLAETLAAFAAADGGIILIGVADDGSIIGVSNFEQVRDSLIYEAAGRSHCEPQIQPINPVVTVVSLVTTDKNMQKLTDKLAKKIWDYHHVNHELKKADFILVLGSHDIRVAERGAQLFIEGWAPLIIFSGGLGNLTRDFWNQPEADTFAELAIKMGVPKDKILIENKSTNTGENIAFTKELLEKHNLNPQKFIVVHKPYMERRSYATFKKVWPEKEVIVTSPQISFEEYPNKEISRDDVINIMVGDLQRIKIYPQKGFQIPQEIPGDIWDAYEKLVRIGYTRHLIIS